MKKPAQTQELGKIVKVPGDVGPRAKDRLHEYNIMLAVQTSYAKERKTDAEFAEYLTKIFGKKVTAARVRSARDSFGIPANERQKIMQEARKLLLDWRSAHNGVIDPSRITFLIERTNELLKWIPRA